MMRKCMSTRAPTPNKPRNPAIADVIKLIGMCNPNIEPKTLAKKINNAPITSLMTPTDVNFIIFNGGPKNSNNTNTATKAKMTTNGSILESPFACPTLPYAFNS